MSTLLRAVAPLLVTLVTLLLMHWTVRKVENLRAAARFPEKQD